MFNKKIGKTSLCNYTLFESEADMYIQTVKQRCITKCDLLAILISNNCIFFFHENDYGYK